MSNDDVSDVFDMTVPGLKSELRQRGLRLTGKKHELQGRLVQAYLDNVPISNPSPPSHGAMSPDSPLRRRNSVGPKPTGKHRPRTLSLEDISRIVGFDGSIAAAASSTTTKGGASKMSVPRRNTIAAIPNLHATGSSGKMPMRTHQPMTTAQMTAMGMVTISNTIAPSPSSINSKPSNKRKITPLPSKPLQPNTMSGLPSWSNYVKTPSSSTSPPSSSSSSSSSTLSITPLPTSQHLLPNLPISVGSPERRNFVLWEWQNFPGDAGERWQPFDEALGQRLTVAKNFSNKPAGAYQPLQVELQQYAHKPPSTFQIDVRKMAFINLTTKEIRKIRVNATSPTKPLKIPVQYLLSVYRLQFHGSPQKLALDLLQEGVATASDTDEVMKSKMFKRIDEENRRLMNQAMDESRNCFEAESQRNRESGKRRRLEILPLQNSEFMTSKMLQSLRHNHKFTHWSSLLSSRASLVELLNYEKKCCHWYPTAEKYFTKAGNAMLAKCLSPSQTNPTFDDDVKMYSGQIQQALISIPSGANGGPAVPTIFFDAEQQAAATDGIHMVRVAGRKGGGETIVLE
eukprot:m.95485 g.95485  ORF g.95485 m.95485 type:complete len:570 (+) comp26821_c0_seq1:262-1971(+)